jgi:pimeloyl-ACP methyl ester carboxylesterase
MKQLRTYGKAPFTVAVIHGGPGAGGEMAPVARELSANWGVLEPIQTATSLEGQVEELRTVLNNDGDAPLTLIGFSWGAWLSFIVTARYPAPIKKLLLVGSGPFDEEYLPRLQETRLSRLGNEERIEYESVIRDLGNPAIEGKDPLLARLRTLTSKTDRYDPIIDVVDESDSAGGHGNTFQSVWGAAAELRRSGKLLEFGKHIQCPVVAIHGEYDPHPAEGVQKPLSIALQNFRFILLAKCGHTPWLERQARESFYSTIREELLKEARFEGVPN